MAVVYTRGMVVDIELPRLDGGGGWKQRPALIVSTDAFHQARPLDRSIQPLNSSLIIGLPCTMRVFRLALSLSS